MRVRFLGIVAVLLIIVTSTLAQAPRPSATFAGTWTIDREKTKVDADAGLFGLGAAGIPATLHITQASNTTVVVESQMNESHARLYVPGARSTTPAGETGTVSMTSTMNGGVLSADGAVESASGGAAVAVKETHTLAADGQTLSITVTTTSPTAQHAGTLVYTRLSSVGSCKIWPTPCKF